MKRFAFTGTFRFAARPPLVVATAQPRPSLPSLAPSEQLQAAEPTGSGQPLRPNAEAPKIEAAKVEIPPVAIQRPAPSGNSATNADSTPQDPETGLNSNRIQTATIIPSPEVRVRSSLPISETTARIEPRTSLDIAAESHTPAKTAVPHFSRDNRSALGARLPAVATAAQQPAASMNAPAGQQTTAPPASQITREGGTPLITLQTASLPSNRQAIEPDANALAETALRLPPLPGLYNRPATKKLQPAALQSVRVPDRENVKSTPPVRRQARVSANRAQPSRPSAATAVPATRSAEPLWMRRALGNTF